MAPRIRSTTKANPSANDMPMVKVEQEDMIVEQWAHPTTQAAPGATPTMQQQPAWLGAAPNANLQYAPTPMPTWTPNHPHITYAQPMVFLNAQGQVVQAPHPATAGPHVHPALLIDSAYHPTLYSHISTFLMQMPPVAAPVPRRGSSDESGNETAGSKRTKRPKAKKTCKARISSDEESGDSSSSRVAIPEGGYVKKEYVNLHLEPLLPPSEIVPTQDSEYSERM